jgi:hypothetical protein
MKTATTLSLVCIATLFAAARARADVPPPETEPCAAKAAGAECTYLGPGVCQEGTCSKPDYSKWDRDASSSPPTTTYPCLKCVIGTATNTATTSPIATDTSTSSQTGTDTSSSSDSGWCSVGKGSAASRWVPWLMAAAFSLLFLVGRRRK